jgi:S1-C subfamily serine protease
MNTHRQNPNSNEGGQTRIRVSRADLRSGTSVKKLLLISMAGLLCIGVLSYALLDFTLPSPVQTNTVRLQSIVGSINDVNTLCNGTVTVVAGRNGASSHQGSGCIMSLTDTKATIATNWHVISPPSQRSCSGWNVDVLFLDERIGTVAGVLLPSTRADIAVLEIELDTNSDFRIQALPMLPDADTLDVLADVVAVGSPFGLEHTYTAGTLSALRTFNETKMLQIDASIWPGSSGGPVFIKKQDEFFWVGVVQLKGMIPEMNYAIDTDVLEEDEFARFGIGTRDWQSAMLHMQQ